MKLIPFSRDFCRDLIRNGYNYFIIRTEAQREELAGIARRTTYRAARQPDGSNVISIEELLNSLEKINEDSYIMVAE